MAHMKSFLNRWNTWSTFLIAVIAFVYFWPAVYDNYLRGVPWINASLEVVPNDGPMPKIRYLAKAETYTRAEWTAWIEVSNYRFCTAHGLAGYGPNNVERLWDWPAFFERHCPVPATEFVVCVRYDALARSGIAREDGPYCSQPYKAEE